jgi:hypothetical protein
VTVIAVAAILLRLVFAGNAALGVLWSEESSGSLLDLSLGPREPPLPSLPSGLVDTGPAGSCPAPTEDSHES